MNTAETRGTDSHPRRRPRSAVVATLAALGAAALAAAPACSVVQAIRPESQSLSDPYRAALARWSRKAEVRDGLTLTLGLVATLRSPEFRKSYVAEVTRLYSLDPSERDEMLAAEIKDANEGIEVMVSAAGPREDWLGLDDRENSTWKLVLTDGRGKRYEPASIQRVKAKDVKNTMLYPYFEDWNHLYSVRFAVPPGEAEAVYRGPFTLLATGILGQAEVSWGHETTEEKPAP